VLPREAASVVKACQGDEDAGGRPAESASRPGAGTPCPPEKFPLPALILRPVPECLQALGESSTKSARVESESRPPPPVGLPQGRPERQTAGENPPTAKLLWHRFAHARNNKKMDTRSWKLWTGCVRDLFLIAVGLGVSTSAAVLAAPPASSTVPSLLKRLSDPRFEVRTAAERDLTHLSAGDIPALEQAATGDAEHAARAVSLLERLYVGQTSTESQQNPARAAVLSSLDAMLTIRRVGDFGETDLTKAAEAGLERLAEGDTPAAPLAQAALTRHAVLAENRAIATLRQLGARVIFSAVRDPMHDALSQLAEGADTIAADALATAAPLAVEHVYILRSWKGGTEGLEHLRRLRVTAGLQLYLVDGCGLKSDDVLPLKATIPGLSPIERSAATLGVRWIGYQLSEEIGCEIAGVTEGLAADKAGLRSNYIITKVDGDPIRTFDDGTSKSLVHRLRDCGPGDTVTLTVMKMMNGPEQDILVTLSDWSEVPDVQVMAYAR